MNLRHDQCLIPEDLGILLPLPMLSLAMLLRCRLVNVLSFVDTKRGRATCNRLLGGLDHELLIVVLFWIKYEHTDGVCNSPREMS